MKQKLLVSQLTTLCIFALNILAPSYLSAQSCASQNCLPQEAFREISVEADSWARISPDFARITVILEESAQKASDAMVKIESKIDSLKKSIESSGLDSTSTIRKRDIDFFPDETHTKPIAPSTTIQARAIIAIDTNEPQHAARLVDIVQSVGKVSVQDFTTLVQSGHEQKLSATQVATRMATEKAERIAKSLGVTLGDLISASAIEDPSGEMLSARRELGQNEIAYGDRDVHIIVNLRYGIKR